MSFPPDITQAAREALSALIALGIDVPAEDHSKAIAVLAATIAADRSSIQRDVVAAVARQDPECRTAVFAALRMGQQQ